MKCVVLGCKRMAGIVNLITSLFRNNFQCLSVFGIVVAAFLIRVAGIGSDLPYFHHSDEITVTAEVYKMLTTGNFEPVHFYYPTLYIYMELIVSIFSYLYAVATGAISYLSELTNGLYPGYSFTMNYPPNYLWMRFLTVTLATFTVYLTYKLAKEAYGDKVGLVAGLFLAFAPGHVGSSNWILVDIPLTFFCIVTVLYSVYVFKWSDWKSYAFAGLFAGLTISTKYCYIIILPLVLGHLLNKSKIGFFNAKFALMIFMVAIGFLVGTPYSLVELGRFLEDVGYQLRGVSVTGYGVVGGATSAIERMTGRLDWLSNYAFGNISTVFAIIGGFIGFKGRFRHHLLLISFPLTYFLYLASSQTGYTRYAIPLIPFLAIFAAVSAVMVGEFFSSKIKALRNHEKKVIMVIVAAAIFFPLKTTITNSWAKIHSVDTRVEATAWLKKNIPAGAKVAFVEELYWFLPDLKGSQFEAIVVQPLTHGLKWYIESGIDYIVTAKRFYGGTERLEDKKGRDLAARYNKIFFTGNVVKEFGSKSTPLPLLRRVVINPGIRILQIPSDFDVLAMKDKLDLDVAGMKRKMETSVIGNKENVASHTAYRDLLVSPRIKFRRGKYIVDITTAGNPKSPNEVKGTLKVALLALAKQGEEDVTLGSFELPAGAAKFTTKEFEINSEDVFQLSFTKETFLTQAESLEFDGVDDSVIIPFKKPLDMPEGTLAFWHAPAVSSSDQTSSVSQINLYTVDGRSIEFADGLLGKEKELYSWFVWSAPGFRLHINLWNRAYKAGEWRHWAGTWKRGGDGSLRMEFYINGEKVGENSVPSDKVSDESPSSIFFKRLEIGKMGKGWHFKGKIAEVRLFNKALQPAQFMQSSLDKNTPFLVGYWKLLGSCDQVVPDLSQNDNNGTLGQDINVGPDDPKCVKMKLPSSEGSAANWLKDVMIRKVR